MENSRREVNQAERDLYRLQKEASPSAQLIDEARRRVNTTRDQYQYVVNNRINIIDDYVRPYRRRMDEANTHYRDIMNRRTEIIERFIAPYKAQVEQAKRALELIQNLHNTVYG